MCIYINLTFFFLINAPLSHLNTHDIGDLLASVEAKIVIWRLIDERNDAHAWESLFDDVK